MDTKQNNKPNQYRWLILAGLLIFVTAIFLLKGRTQPDTDSTSGTTPQERLAQALESGKPVLAFYHSNNCESCIEMIAIIDDVYPEFQEEVVLVDVNVYDPQNQSLLQTVGLRYIPTQMLYDRTGQPKTIVGVMPAETLREALHLISTGQ